MQPAVRRRSDSGKDVRVPSTRSARLWRAIDYAALALAAMAALALLTLLLLVSASALGRHLFGSDLVFSADFARMLLALIVAGSVAFGARHGSHFHLDLLGMLAGNDDLRAVDLFSRVTGLLVVGALVAALWLLGDCRTSCGAFDTIDIPFAPFYQILALGMACYAVMLLVEIAVLMMRGRDR